MANNALTSHHVNYLIWRYLQESGHGKAAEALRCAWNQEPQKLPFAPYIKTHALITLVQKGLQYDDLEKSIDPSGNVTPEPPSFFGPSNVKSNSPQRSDEQEEMKVSGPAERPSSPSPKPAPDGLVNGEPHDELLEGLPESSKTNGNDEGDVSLNQAAAPMEVEKNEEVAARSVRGPSSPAVELVLDADGDVGMTSPQVQEPPAPIFTLTNGESVGVQIAPPKAADLTPDTTLIDLVGNHHVIRTAWRPDDPFLVAASGDAFCGLWKLSGQRSSTVLSHATLVDGPNVTALDWEPTGKMLALATYENLMGTVTMYNLQGAVVDLLPTIPGLVSGVRWAHKGRKMVLTTSDDQKSELLFWDQELRPDSFPPGQVINGSIYNVVWSGDEQIYVGGDGAIYECQVQDNIQISKTFRSEESPEEPWTLLTTTNFAGSSIIAAASTSTTYIWIPSHDIKIDSAHHGDITSLEFRPHAELNETKDANLILATSSMDETVKLWGIDLNSKQAHCIHRLFLGPSLPALVATFSPDGYAIAAATHDKLFIWNVERGGAPMATWPVPCEKVEDEVNQDGAVVSEPNNLSMLDRPLSWDSDSKKLALGFGSKIAIVNLQR